MSGLARPLAIALLCGTALLAAGGALHPMLAGDAAAQLRTIADTSYWRMLHLVMLGASGLVIGGVWVRLVTDRGEATAPLVAALAVIGLGLAINALNIAFMAGAGWRMASLFVAGQPDMPALFEVTHPIGLMAARFGNFLVAFGALALGWVEWRDPARPRWLAYLAWLAAAAGFIGVVFFDEGSRLALAAVGVLSLWEIATAICVLRSSGSQPVV